MVNEGVSRPVHTGFGFGLLHLLRLHIVVKFASLCKRKVPAKVPAKTVLDGLKLVEKDMLGFGLTVNVTQL